MTFDLGYAIAIAPLLISATAITFAATIGGFAVACAGGLMLAGARSAKSHAIALPAALFVDFVRSTPLLIQMFFLFYIMPRYGVRLEALTTGILALGLHYSAYISEVYRSGIESVPRGQWEAARALNLGTWSTWRGVILPQAIPPILPALGNYLIAMFKDTPLLATITVPELLGAALIEASRSFRFLEPITLVGLIFLCLSLPSSLAVHQLEKRLDRRR